jgi:hypothetical protein
LQSLEGPGDVKNLEGQKNHHLLDIHVDTAKTIGCHQDLPPCPISFRGKYIGNGMRLELRPTGNIFDKANMLQYLRPQYDDDDDDAGGNTTMLSVPFSRRWGDHRR